ncbi:hypothetical protein HOY82DRAFT_543182 [Tuber indicum]|nr:hypothetical protein HOY82DRAFT_543182 [Tuber indicum]
MPEQPTTRPSAKTRLPPRPPICHSEPQPKPNILPLLVLQQRSLFKTLSDGFEKLQSLVSDRNCPEQERVEKASVALGELSDRVRAIRCRMDAFIGIASDAGCIELAGTNQSGGGNMPPPGPASTGAGETKKNAVRNFSRPFPHNKDVDPQDQDCDSGRSRAATIGTSRGGMNPTVGCSFHYPTLPPLESHTEPPGTAQERRLQVSGDPEHDQTSTTPTRPAPSPNAPSAQGDIRPLRAPPRVSVLINSPLEGTDIRQQVKRASRVRDPYFNEVRRISVLKTGVIRTTYYQAEPRDVEDLVVEDENSLSLKNINTPYVDCMGRIIRNGRGFHSWVNVGKVIRE